MMTPKDDKEKYNIVLDDDPMISEIVEKTTGIRSMRFTNVEDVKAVSRLAGLLEFAN